MNLAKYCSTSFDRGRSRWIEALWIFAEAIFVDCWLPGSVQRRWILRLFGARVGEGVVLKPRLKVKFPWRLEIGNHTWIGENVWIDNLAPVRIGSHCCISQGAYLCTGSHDWRADSFDLVCREIVIEDQCWIGAKSSIAPGVRAGNRAVLTIGSVATRNLESNWIYQGHPAQPIRLRTMSADGTRG